MRPSCFSLALVALLFGFALHAEEPAPPKPAATPTAAQQELYTKFEKSLSGASLVGQFTMTGTEPGKLHEERYTITKVSKLPDGDYFMFTARIKYGEKDITVPMPLEVKWAGTTPVITLDKVAIPGLGTFNARVVIDGERYAGTWAHDTVGGHLFGRIEREAEKK